VSKVQIILALAFLVAAPLLAQSSLPVASPTPLKPPAIQSLLKPEAYRRLIADRQILTSASLDDVPGSPGLSRYSFYVAMQARADLARTRRVLTDYRLYSRLIPYVDKTVYSPITRILDVEGGVWKWRLRSFVQFEERGDQWIHYQIVDGHFRGLEGDLFFEEARGKSITYVYFRGTQQGARFPPRLVIEQGAQIVFGFTASRMRKYLESHEEEKPNDGQNLPQPRSRL
jgi:hypothetical protein